MSEKAGVGPVRIMQVLPQLLCIQIKIDIDGTFFCRRSHFLLEVGRDVINNMKLGFVTWREDFFLLPLLLLSLTQLRSVGADSDLAGPGVSRLRHLEQFLGELAETLVVLPELQVNVQPGK